MVFCVANIFISPLIFFLKQIQITRQLIHTLSHLLLGNVQVIINEKLGKCRF
jgi:hypothetical protein